MVKLGYVIRDIRLSMMMNQDEFSNLLIKKGIVENGIAKGMTRQNLSAIEQPSFNNFEMFQHIIKLADKKFLFDVETKKGWLTYSGK